MKIVTILRNKLTGLFFDGTNFSCDRANKATHVEGLSPNDYRLVWGENTQVIEVETDVLAKLDKSDELEARAEAHHAKCWRLSDREAAPHYSAITKLRKRYLALAVEVYSSFPKTGRNA